MSPAAGPDVLRLGTRGSRLALWQADEVTRRLAAAHPGVEIRRVIVKTVGDKILDTPLSKIGDKGLFTKELDIALRREEIDIAVHSLKDLPTEIPEGLVIGAVLEREAPNDVLVSAAGRRLMELPGGARVGTSSLRRRSQILALRPDITIVDLRGNVPTRLERAARGEFDAIVLARAGIVRLGFASRITEVLEPDLVLPAVGQGAVAVQHRSGDPRVAAMIGALDHRPTRLAVMAERSLLRRLEGGCQAPIGALAWIDGRRLAIEGLVAGLDGKPVFRAHEEGEAITEPAAAAIGVKLAEDLLAMGGRELLDGIFRLARQAPLPSTGGGGESA
jgi:hydroxymethylbilane synthase